MTTINGHVGHIVFTTTRKAAGDPARLRAAMDKHCPALAGMVPAPMAPHTALRAATRRKAPAGYRWADVGVDGDWAVAALTEATADPSLRDYKETTAAYVAANAVTGEWIDDPGHTSVTRAAVDAAHARYDEARGVLGAAALWDVVQAACARMGGVRAKDGVYLVPAGAALADDLVAGVEAAYRDAETGVAVIRIATDTTGAAALKDAVTVTLWDAVTSLKTDLAEKLARMRASGRRLRSDGVLGLVNEAQDVADRATLMEMATGAVLRDLKAQVAEFQQAVRAASEASAADYVAPPAAPVMDAEEAADRAALGL